ncbi:hypothetical protein MKX96_13930 [Psychrobacillus sp. FSL W7-1493]|uniref:hypothetical protein n=1 Tax=Psychrobacillus sp. FSL W7-1493 TaxID=2921552 RepID=UPI0030F56703
MKIIVGFISMLLVVTNCVLLLFQYEVYSSNIDEEVQDFSYEQEVDVQLFENSIQVNHHFFNLPKEKVSILWPIASENRSCLNIAGDSCKRSTEDLSSFLEGENSSQSVSYTFPLPNGLKEGVVLSDFLLKLENGDVTYTTLHITDSLKRGGMWVSGLPKIGNSSLDLIDYSLSIGEGTVQELYWQQEALPIQYQNDHYSVYSKEPVAAGLQKLLDELQLPNTRHSSILVEDNTNKVNASNILFLGNEDLPSIQRDIAVKNIQDGYNLPIENLLLAEVVSSFLMESPVGAEKSIWMYETLTSYLTNSQLLEWKSLLENQKELSAEKLDKLLSSLLDSKTSFFEWNDLQKDKFPLLFEDSRPVYINDGIQKDIDVLFKDGKVLYAAEPLFDVLGYTYDDTDKGLYVQNETRAFRFPIQEPFYVYNQKRYDAMSEPFEKIGSKFYIEETWMIRLFLLNIDKEDGRIHLQEETSN